MNEYCYFLTSEKMYLWEMQRIRIIKELTKKGYDLSEINFMDKQKWIVVLKTFEGPLENKEIKPVNPKGNQLWIFIGRTDAENEAPILWSPNGESWLNGKKRLRFWERLKSGGEGSDRGWDGWIASPTQRTWVWANARR